jgi:hypothetical protein
VPQDADVLLKLSLIEEGLVRIPVDPLDVRVFDGGHAFAVQHLLDVENSLPHLLRSGGRDEAGDRFHGGLFLEDAGGVAVRVAVDGAGGGVGCGGGDVGQFKSE